MYEYCQIRDFAEIMPDIMYQSYIDGCPWNHAGTRNGGCGGRPKKEGEVAMAIAKGLKRMFGNKQVLEFICGAINDKQADDMKPANRRQQMRGQRGNERGSALSLFLCLFSMGKSPDLKTVSWYVDALTSLHVPEDDEKILRVVSVKGANLYELTDGENHVGLYTLPKALRYVVAQKRPNTEQCMLFAEVCTLKYCSYRHVVAIRPGSYVIAAAYSHREGRVNGEIIHVPMKPHVDYLRKLPCW